jgi:hypothetical protein
LSDLSFEEYVKAFLTIREEREKLLREYEAADKALKEEASILEGHMLTVCNETDASSIKTGSGTVIRKLNERYICNDWENLKKFILENEAVELLERRIHQSNFKEFMSEHKGDGLPPGVNVMREYAVVVRKPSN